MLQAIKLDSAPLSQETKSRDALQDVMAPHFAGILAHLVTGVPLPGPVPTPPMEPKSSAAEFATASSGPNTSRSESKPYESKEVDDSPPEKSREEAIGPEESSPSESAPAAQAENPNAASSQAASAPSENGPKTPEQANVSSEATPSEALSAPTPPASPEAITTTPLPTDLTKVPEIATVQEQMQGQIQESAPAAAEKSGGALPMPTKAEVRATTTATATTTASAAQVLPSPTLTSSVQIQLPTPTRSATSTEQVGAPLKLHYQPSLPVPVEKAAWADLLYVPRVELETPRHLSETISRPLTPHNPPAESAAKVAEAPPQAPNQGSVDATKEAAAGMALPKAEGRVGGSSLGNFVPSVSGAAAAASEAAGAKTIQASMPTTSLVMPKSMPLLSQMEGSLRWMIKNGVQSAEMQLQPDSLGKVAIQLRVERGEVHARLWASEPGTVPLLQSHKALLESSLREQGLHLASFDLQQGSRGGDRNPMEHQTLQPTPPITPYSAEDQQEVPSQADTLLASPYRIEVVA